MIILVYTFLILFIVIGIYALVNDPLDNNIPDRDNYDGIL